MRKDSIKILYLSRDRFPPFRPDVEVLFAKMLSSRHYTIDWLLTSEEICSKSYKTRWNKHTVWVGKNYKAKTLLYKIINAIQYLINDFKLFNLLKKHNYDIIQVKDKYLACALAIIATRKSCCQFTFWLSFPYDTQAKEYAENEEGIKALLLNAKAKYITFIMMRLIVPNASHIFVQSDTMKESYVKAGVDVSKLTVVPMGVDIDETRKINGISTDHDVIAYLGSLAKPRKIDFLIRVLEKVKVSRPQATLLLVGAGERTDDELFLLSYATLKGLGNDISITGFLPRDEAWRKIKSASLCVSPIVPNATLACSSPTKLVEYMALEKTSVANDIPDQKRLIEQSGGGLCVPYNEKCFADAIIHLLNRPTERAELATKGKNYIEKNRNYHVIADIVDKTYQGLVSDP